VPELLPWDGRLISQCAEALDQARKAISQVKEGIQVCGGCSALGQLHKDLGLIYLHSGDSKDCKLVLESTGYGP
jgi:hypothetical protein